MKTIFADASYFVALLLDQDLHSEQARDFSANYSGQILTRMAVLAEVGNYLSRSQIRGQFARFVSLLGKNPWVEIVLESQDLWDRAVALYGARPDKSWSLTDCLSFLVMQDRGLIDAVTADRHFEQAGFTILLK